MTDCGWFWAASELIGSDFDQCPTVIMHTDHWQPWHVDEIAVGVSYSWVKNHPCHDLRQEPVDTTAWSFVLGPMSAIQQGGRVCDNLQCYSTLDAMSEGWPRMMIIIFLVIKFIIGYLLMHSHGEVVVHAQTALLMLKPCLLLSNHEYFNLALSLSLNHRYFPCTVISNDERSSIYM